MSHSQEYLDGLRHSCAHLLAAAVEQLYPEVKKTIGPSIENGFYFDFDFGDVVVSEKDFPRIQKRMKKILNTWKGFERHELTVDEVKEEYAGNEYKLEMIDEFAEEGKILTVYQSGEYRDLCRGGHVDEDPKQAMKHFKLLSVAGAYWRGDENNPMLTRIYGTSFPSAEELQAHLTMLEEAKKRDHRKLGKELDLFTFSDKVGAGLPLWTPRGTFLRNILENYVWELRQERGYEKVEIPHITKKDLYETSGHWAKYSEDLFKINTREGHEFAMKPMNCPHHTQIFDRKPHSYREMPQRYANTTMVYRDEQTGELHGLSRVRSITQDDAHVFCRESQIKEEMLKIWDIIEHFYGAVGFGELKIRLSLRDPQTPEKYLGSDESWELMEGAIRQLVEEKGIENPIEGLGEAAFYGPKIDFMTRDSIGREWQVATIQIDKNQPESFDLHCINEEGEQERIVMIHAAIMGSIERFLSIFIEHHAGAFPLWTAPVQIQLIPVGEGHRDYAASLAEEFESAGLRVEVDNADESVGKKIRRAVKAKVPYQLVIGDKEMSSEDLMVRKRGEEDASPIAKAAFIASVQELIAHKSISL